MSKYGLIAYLQQKKNLVQSASRSMFRSKLSQNKQTLSAATSENKFLHWCFVYTFPCAIDLNFFLLLIVCKSNCYRSDACADLRALAVLLCCLRNALFFFTKVWYLKVHHMYCLEITTIQSLSTLLLY